MGASAFAAKPLNSSPNRAGDAPIGTRTEQVPRCKNCTELYTSADRKKAACEEPVPPWKPAFIRLWSARAFAAKVKMAVQKV
jgi:hypothetical protein